MPQTSYGDGATKKYSVLGFICEIFFLFSVGRHWCCVQQPPVYECSLFRRKCM